MREGTPELLKEAVKHLKEALRLDPENVDALVCLARVYEKQSQNSLAAETYELAVSQQNCTNVNAHFYYGVLSEKMKETNRALALLKKCLVLD